ncbi:DUF6538 domain-containing protein [Zymomonas mobilis]|uniref:DUF6538 domain-containing protein n=1 Tax=Zymomonas mobilis TaxID=542 RepID=UPI0001A7769D|nr:DUF6538 domain-containing protein [Zymomonas mobilis]
MPRIRGTTYHFRRIVPPTLRAALSRREIWVSLKTGYHAKRHHSLQNYSPSPILSSLNRML